jgi:hypothetical protein
VYALIRSYSFGQARRAAGMRCDDRPQATGAGIAAACAVHDFRFPKKGEKRCLKTNG